MTPIDVTLLLIIWVICYALFSGVGILVSTLAGLRSNTWRFAWFWIGWAVTIAALQLSHLFKPVDSTDQLVVLAGGVIGILIGSRQWRPFTWPTSRSCCILAGIAVVAIFIAHHALVPPRAYDTGTYHLPSVRWLNLFPIVPGLGNLHVRLAFNSSGFLYNALMNAGIASGFTINVSAGLLVAAIAGELIWTGTALQIWRHTPGVAAACLLAVPFLLSQTYGVAFEGLSPDLVLYACGLEIVVLLLQCSLRPSEDTRALEEFAVIVIAAVACTVKLTFVAFAAGAMLWVAAAGHDPATSRARLVAGGIVMIAATTWIVRNVVLSGYPLFPSPVLPIDVPWRVPLETARQNFGWIRAWARLVNDNSMRIPFERILSNWDWFGPWLRFTLRNLWDVALPLVFATASVVPFIVSAPIRLRAERRSLALLGVPSVAIACWFVTAPDVRFAGALFVALAMVACGVLLEALPSPAWRSRAIVIICVLSVALVGKQTHNMYKWWRSWPAPVHVGWLPDPVTLWFETDAGLRLRVPAVAETCWSAPPPCTPYPSSLLRLNRVDRPGSGFRVSPFREDLIVGWWTAARPWEAMKPFHASPRQ